MVCVSFCVFACKTYFRNFQNNFSHFQYNFLSRKAQKHILKHVLTYKHKHMHNPYGFDKSILPCRKRSYTDTGSFTLRCGVCQIGVVGQKVLLLELSSLHIVHHSLIFSWKFRTLLFHFWRWVEWTGGCGACTSNRPCKLPRVQMKRKERTESTFHKSSSSFLWEKIMCTRFL